MKRTRTPKQLPEELLTVKEAAKRLKMSDRWVWSRIKDGDIKALKFGPRCTRIDAAEIVRYAYREQEGVA